MGIKHPSYIDLSEEEWTDWCAFNLLSPIGQWRQDALLAIQRNDSSTRHHDLNDLMPVWSNVHKEIKDKQFSDEMVAFLKGSQNGGD